MNRTMNPRRPLEGIQRWMQTTITHPDGIVAGMNSPSAREEIGLGADEAEKVVTRSKALTAAERLSIYSSAYYGRLLECMREEFPVLKHALGEEVFDAFAVGYLRQYPSRSYTLFQLGANFPRFLDETRPGPEGEESPAAEWSDFFIDLAKLERNFNEVFDGPGVEAGRLLDADQVRSISPARLLEASLVGAPCLRLLRLRYPVHHYFVAVRRQEEPEPPAAAETFLAVTRRSYVVRHHELSRTAYELLRALLAGESVGQALRQAVEGTGPDIDHLPDILAAWFHDWAAEGFFRGVKPAG